MRAFLENSYLPIRCLQLRTSTLALLTTTIDPLVESLKILIDALDGRTNPFINGIHLKGNVSKLRINLGKELGLRIDDASILGRDPCDLQEPFRICLTKGGVQND